MIFGLLYWVLFVWFIYILNVYLVIMMDIRDVRLIDFIYLYGLRICFVEKVIRLGRYLFY